MQAPQGRGSTLLADRLDFLYIADPAGVGINLSNGRYRHDLDGRPRRGGEISKSAHSRLIFVLTTRGRPKGTPNG